MPAVVTADGEDPIGIVDHGRVYADRMLGRWFSHALARSWLGSGDLEEWKGLPLRGS